MPKLSKPQLRVLAAMAKHDGHLRDCGYGWYMSIGWSEELQPSRPTVAVLERKGFIEPAPEDANKTQAACGFRSRKLTAAGRAALAAAGKGAK